MFWVQYCLYKLFEVKPLVWGVLQQPVVQIEPIYIHISIHYKKTGASFLRPRALGRNLGVVACIDDYIIVLEFQKCNNIPHAVQIMYLLPFAIVGNTVTPGLL